MNNHLKVLKLGFNHFGPNGTYHVVRSVWENQTLRQLGVENTSLKIKEAPEAGDACLQRLFNLKEEINFLKTKQGGENAKVEVEIEFPKRQRLWIYPPSELQVEDHEIHVKKRSSDVATADRWVYFKRG